MSDVKNEAQELAEMFQTKADKSDLEGFVKAEQVEEVANAIVEKKLAELPAQEVKEEAEVIKGYTTPETLIEKNFDVVESAPIVKAINSVNATTGDQVTTNTPYHTLTATNPFRNVARVIPVASSSFKLPSLSHTTVTKNGAAPFSTPNEATLSSASVNVDHYRSLQQISEVEEADLPGIVASYQMDAVRQLALAEETSIITALDAATITETNTGVATGLPTAVSVWFDLIGSLAPQYHTGAAFVMNFAAWNSVRQLAQNGTGSDLVVDIDARGFFLMGYPVYISTQMDPGNAANQNPVYFGNFDEGLVIGSRSDISLRTSRENSLGHISSLTEMRSGVAVRDAAALRRFNVAS